MRGRHRRLPGEAHLREAFSRRRHARCCERGRHEPASRVGHPLPPAACRHALPAQRAAALAIVAAVVGFIALIEPAMRAYPGGTVWDPATRGNDFWLNYLSDLQRTVAINGEPNRAGALYARAAMLLLALGLAPFWVLLTRLFAERVRLGRAVRASGAVSVLCAVAAGFLPSDRYAEGHAVAIAAGGIAGCGGRRRAGNRGPGRARTRRVAHDVARRSDGRHLRRRPAPLSLPTHRSVRRDPPRSPSWSECRSSSCSPGCAAPPGAARRGARGRDDGDDARTRTLSSHALPAYPHPLLAPEGR